MKIIVEELQTSYEVTFCYYVPLQRYFLKLEDNSYNCYHNAEYRVYYILYDKNYSLFRRVFNTMVNYSPKNSDWYPAFDEIMRALKAEEPIGEVELVLDMPASMSDYLQQERY